MIQSLTSRRHGPIGVDLGTRSVKLVQLSADGKRLIDAARWDLPPADDVSDPWASIDRSVEALQRAREGRSFRGRDVTICLDHDRLFLQNIRVPQGDSAAISRFVRQEAAGRIPFPIAETEFRYLEADNVRQGETAMREVILLACHKPVLNAGLTLFDLAGFRVTAIDVQPAALLRSYVRQYRRDEDRTSRVMFVHVGYSRTTVVIAEDERILFVKYIDLAGKQFDQSVGQHLEMSLSEAGALRRHHGDRRSQSRDPVVAESVAAALRGDLDRLASEIAMCVRYHSVTFRGKTLNRAVLGGGEAGPILCEALDQRLELPLEMGDPLRCFETQLSGEQRGQWDVATGLAWRQVQA